MTPLPPDDDAIAPPPPLIERPRRSDQFDPHEEHYGIAPYRDPEVERQFDPYISQSARDALSGVFFHPGGPAIDPRFTPDGIGGLYHHGLGQPFGSPYLTDEDRPLLARHETLHALQFRMEPYAQDFRDGGPGTGMSFLQTLWPHLGAVWPLLTDASDRFNGTFKPDVSDPSHLWLGLAHIAIDPARARLLPRPIRDYFAPLVGTVDEAYPAGPR